MITKDEIQELLHSTETYRVERTTSTADMDKFQEAICASANDLPNSRKNGYLILGAYDNGEYLPAAFNVNLITAFKVEVKRSQSYTKENGGNVVLIEMTDIQKGIIDLTGTDSSISIDQMAVKLAVKKRTLERELAKMKQKGYISRTGSPRSGKWEVIIPYNSVIEIV